MASSLSMTGCKTILLLTAVLQKLINQMKRLLSKTLKCPKSEKIAVIKVKDYGEIKIKLFAEEAKAAAPVPEKNAVDNFIGLADKGYYDELIFHRIIPNFMIQGGDPKGDGTGGNSTWGGEFDGGLPEGLYHFSGAVAYANSNGTSTDGSQFYIVDTPADKVYYGGHYDESGCSIITRLKKQILICLRMLRINILRLAECLCLTAIIPYSVRCLRIRYCTKYFNG